MDKKLLIKIKTIGTPLIIFYLNIIFIIFQPQVFNSFKNMITIILLNVIVSLDIIIRPPFFSEKKDKYKSIIIFIIFLICPILFYLPYLEYKVLSNQYLSQLLILIIWIVGNLTLIIGGIVLIIARIILGQYGSPKIIIKEQHKLITRGPYKYVRHSVYLGDLLFIFGYSFAFSGIISSIIISAFLYFVMKNRMDLEEKLLLETFGDEYKDYMKHTKRLLPFIY